MARGGMFSSHYCLLAMTTTRQKIQDGFIDSFSMQASKEKNDSIGLTNIMDGLYCDHSLIKQTMVIVGPTINHGAEVAGS
jgi:hypothetical protein